MSPTSNKEFKDLFLLTVNIMFDKCIHSTLLKLSNGNCLYYLNEVFKFAPEGNFILRTNFLKLKHLFQKTKQLPKRVIIYWSFTLKKVDIV